jgi:hypothetical protein
MDEVGPLFLFLDFEGHRSQTSMIAICMRGCYLSLVDKDELLGIDSEKIIRAN